MGLTEITRAAPVTRRIWPITAMLVLVAAVLMLRQWFLAVIMTAPFFGDTPSRGNYILSAMACLTTLPAFAAMIWCGRQRGCQRGLWLIGGAALLMGWVGLNLLGTAGDARDPDPGRWPNLADLFGDSTWLSWVATVVFVAVAVTTRQLRRRTRHTELDSAA